MAYSPNDRGPQIPQTRSKVRSSGIWIGLLAIVGIIWTQSETEPGSDPAKTASTTQDALPVSPVPGATERSQTPPAANPASR